MNQYLHRPSTLVVDHIRDLLQPISDYKSGTHTIHPLPKSNLTRRENQLFWRYHGHFPCEFAKAIQSFLPNHYEFLEYDHLKNQLRVEVK